MEIDFHRARTTQARFEREIEAKARTTKLKHYRATGGVHKPPRGSSLVLCTLKDRLERVDIRSRYTSEDPQDKLVSSIPNEFNYDTYKTFLLRNRVRREQEKQHRRNEPIKEPDGGASADDDSTIKGKSRGDREYQRSRSSRGRLNEGTGVDRTQVSEVSKLLQEHQECNAGTESSSSPLRWAESLDRDNELDDQLSISRAPCRPQPPVHSTGPYYILPPPKYPLTNNTNQLTLNIDRMGLSKGRHSPSDSQLSEGVLESEQKEGTNSTPYQEVGEPQDHELAASALELAVAKAQFASALNGQGVTLDSTSSMSSLDALKLMVSEEKASRIGKEGKSQGGVEAEGRRRMIHPLDPVVDLTEVQQLVQDVWDDNESCARISYMLRNCAPISPRDIEMRKLQRQTRADETEGQKKERQRRIEELIRMKGAETSRSSNSLKRGSSGDSTWGRADSPIGDGSLAMNTTPRRPASASTSSSSLQARKVPLIPTSIRHIPTLATTSHQAATAEAFHRRRNQLKALFRTESVFDETKNARVDHVFLGGRNKVVGTSLSQMKYWDTPTESMSERRKISSVNNSHVSRITSDTMEVGASMAERYTRIKARLKAVEGLRLPAENSNVGLERSEGSHRAIAVARTKTTHGGKHEHSDIVDVAFRRALGENRTRDQWSPVSRLPEGGYSLQTLKSVVDGGIYIPPPDPKWTIPLRSVGRQRSMACRPATAHV